MLPLVIGQARCFKYAIRHLFKQNYILSSLQELQMANGSVAHYRIVVDYEVITRIES